MLDILEKGGWVIITIMACSLVACAVIIERWLYYRSADSQSARIRALLTDPAASVAATFAEESVRQSVYGKMWTAAAMIPACECDARLGNPQMLAAGISEALYNTAGGLLVAIPCIIANNHFRNRVERLLHWTEGCVGEIARRACV